MITIATFSKPEEAHLFRTRLEAGGVPAYVLDENLVQLDWLYSNAIGGVRVQIDEEDLDSARAILSEAPEPLPDVVTVTCPVCSSEKVAPDELPRRLSYAGLLFLGFPFFVSRHRYRCHACGAKWDEDRRPEPSAVRPQSHPWLRPVLWLAVLASLAGLVFIGLNPLHSLTLRILFLGCLLLAWSGLLVLSWRRKFLAIPLLVLPVLLALPFFLPARPYEASLLRSDYLAQLVKYEGAPYLWGGEAPSGIDCSGLARRAFRDVLLAYGFKYGNGQAYRDYLRQWWTDATARDLAAGRYGYTVATGQQGTIRDLDYDELLPGDLAITTSGVHMLIYAGHDRWLQADPNSHEVILLNGRTDANPWFDTPVTIHRWRQLVD